jgi:adenosylcobinamide-phosphate guanylyltransferase
MALTAIVMAGGKGERLKADVEKPLLMVGRKPMIRRVIEALLASPSVGKLVVAVSPNTPKTREYVSGIRGIELLETSGNDYHEDVKDVIRKVGVGHFLIVSADLPLLSPEAVEKIIRRYFEKKKPALTVVVPLDKLSVYGTSTTYVMRIGGENYVPCGINIIDGSEINQNYIDEDLYIWKDPEVFINVNTLQDLLIAEGILRKRERQSNDQQWIKSYGGVQLGQGL